MELGRFSDCRLWIRKWNSIVDIDGCWMRRTLAALLSLFQIIGNDERDGFNIKMCHRYELMKYYILDSIT